MGYHSLQGEKKNGGATTEEEVRKKINEGKKHDSDNKPKQSSQKAEFSPKPGSLSL